MDDTEMSDIPSSPPRRRDSPIPGTALPPGVERPIRDTPPGDEDNNDTPRPPGDGVNDDTPRPPPPPGDSADSDLPSIPANDDDVMMTRRLEDPTFASPARPSTSGGNAGNGDDGPRSPFVAAPAPAAAPVRVLAPARVPSGQSRYNAAQALLWQKFMQWKFKWYRLGAFGYRSSYEELNDVQKAEVQGMQVPRLSESGSGRLPSGVFEDGWIAPARHFANRNRRLLHRLGTPRPGGVAQNKLDNAARIINNVARDFWTNNIKYCKMRKFLYGKLKVTQRTH